VLGPWTVLEDHVVVAGILAHFGFIIRDVCLILALNFGARRGRADIAALITLAVLYVLVPWILRIIGEGPALFLPGSLDWPWINLAVAALHCMAGILLLGWRWPRVQAQIAVTPGRSEN
jgi:hypothetical protein